MFRYLTVAALLLMLLPWLACASGINSPIVPFTGTLPVGVIELGPPNTDGSWRLRREFISSGESNLHTEYYSGALGAWTAVPHITQYSVSAGNRVEVSELIMRQAPGDANLVKIKWTVGQGIIIQDPSTSDHARITSSGLLFSTRLCEAGYTRVRYNYCQADTPTAVTLTNNNCADITATFVKSFHVRAKARMPENSAVNNKLELSTYSNAGCTTVVEPDLIVLESVTTPVNTKTNYLALDFTLRNTFRLRYTTTSTQPVGTLVTYTLLGYYDSFID